MRNIQQVQCNMTRHSSVSASFLVQFISFPVIPYENNLYSHTGNPPVDAFVCDASLITPSSAQCQITDITPANASLPGNTPQQTKHLLLIEVLFVFYM